MKMRHALLIGITCTLSSSMVLAATSLTAEQIAERNVSARGGLTAWQRIQSMTLSGQIDAGRERIDGGRVGLLAHPHARAEMKAVLRKTAMAPDEASRGKIIQLPFRMDLERPGKSRIEVQFKGDTAVQVFDGNNGWKLRPFIGRREVEKFTPDEARQAAQQQDLDGPLIGYAAKGTHLALRGMEKVDGRNAYKLQLTLKNGEVRQLWVDAQTFLDVRYDGPPRQYDGKQRTVSTYFRDYKPVNGVVLPHLLETTVDGVNNTQRIIVEKIALNPPLDEARFTRPE
jgi:outer membrane lipoprotein-sorting protein